MSDFTTRTDERMLYMLPINPHPSCDFASQTNATMLPHVHNFSIIEEIFSYAEEVLAMLYCSRTSSDSTSTSNTLSFPPKTYSTVLQPVASIIY